MSRCWQLPSLPEDLTGPSRDDRLSRIQWLVVERSDVVLLIGGDRDAGLDADALTAIAQSIS
jgi:hypothetical protein